MMNLKLFTKLSLILPLYLFSYSEERTFNNLASDYADCTAYYMIAAVGAENGNNQKLKKRMNEMAGRMFNISVELSNKKTSESRVQLSIKSQKKEMDNHYNNFSRLLLKYNEFCKKLSLNFENRLQYWRNKE
jgi:Lhr-like helicase